MAATAGAAAAGLFSGDKLSALMGAPLHKWKKSEVKQIKRIQKQYEVAYGAENKRKGSELDETLAHEVATADNESFLPKDSPLRSRDGERGAPENVVFKNYDMFVRSCRMDYWDGHFTTGLGDRMLAETARTMISKICVAQSRNELRSHKGHAPFRKHREHITPLALTLHEIKTWCITFLRTADPYNEGSFEEIRKRKLYIQSLSLKEVWGNYNGSYAQGIRKKGQETLFRVFSAQVDELQRAEEYCYRTHSKRSSREKLKAITDALKSTLLNEMRVLSGRFDYENKLESATTSRLEPLDLLSEVENLQSVDFKNPVNVLLYRMFQNPFVQACFTEDFENEETREFIESIGNWHNENLFVQRGHGEPRLLMEMKRKGRFLPAVYQPTFEELKLRIREVDGKSQVPDDGKKVIERFSAIAGSEEKVEQMFVLLTKSLAALQDVMPTMFAMYKLYSLAGDGGDYTVFDTMRANVLAVTEDAEERISTLKASSKALKRYIDEMYKEEDENLKKLQRRKGKLKYRPVWMNNHKYIASSMSKVYREGYRLVLQKLQELAVDAKEYCLTSDQLSDKVQAAKRVFEMIAKSHDFGVVGTGNDEEVEVVVPPMNKRKKEVDEDLRRSSHFDSDLDDSDVEEEKYVFSQRESSRNPETNFRPQSIGYNSDEESEA